MDLRCPRCGEPWDLDTLHDEVSARSGTDQGSPHPWTRPDGRHDEASYAVRFAQVREDFAARGCEAITSCEGRCPPDRAGRPVALHSALLMSLLGDDIDAVAAMTEDLDL